MLGRGTSYTFPILVSVAMDAIYAARSLFQASMR